MQPDGRRSVAYAGMIEHAFNLVIPATLRRLVRRHAADPPHLLADPSVPEHAITMLRQRYDFVVIAPDVGAALREGGASLFDFCRRFHAVLLSFDAYGLWHMPLEQGPGVVLVDVGHDRVDAAAHALRAFFDHKRSVSAHDFQESIIKLTPQGYAIRYLHNGIPYQFAVRYRGGGAVPDFMAEP